MKNLVNTGPGALLIAGAAGLVIWLFLWLIQDIGFFWGLFWGLIIAAVVLLMLLLVWGGTGDDGFGTHDAAASNPTPEPRKETSTVAATGAATATSASNRGRDVGTTGTTSGAELVTDTPPASETPPPDAAPAATPPAGSRDSVAAAEPVAAAAPEVKPDTTPTPADAAEVEARADTGASSDAPGEGTKPAMLDAPRASGADNLKEIKGVGPKLEATLNEMGIYHFDQIANFSDQEVAWVDQNLKGFKGRVSRDNWVEQAKTLAAGGETEFSKKVDKGGMYD